LSGVIPLTNGVPLSYSTAAGATNFFSFDITQTNAAVLFELYNLTGNGDLNAQRGSLPLAPPYFTNSANPGTNYEQIVIRTNSGLTDINAVSWFLGVPNNDPGSISYTIRAVLPTNGLLISAIPINVGASVLGGTNIQLNWPAVSGEKYQVLTSTNLALPLTNWTILTTITAAVPATTYISPTPVSSSPTLFYSVVQVP
jgi:hypothetical protein